MNRMFLKTKRRLYFFLFCFFFFFSFAGVLYECDVFDAEEKRRRVFFFLQSYHTCFFEFSVPCLHPHTYSPILRVFLQSERRKKDVTQLTNNTATCYCRWPEWFAGSDILFRRPKLAKTSAHRSIFLTRRLENE